MKKVIGWLLVICLIVQLSYTGISSYAAEMDSGEELASGESMDEGKTSVEEETGDGTTDLPDVTGGDMTGGVPGNSADGNLADPADGSSGDSGDGSSADPADGVPENSVNGGLEGTEDDGLGNQEVSGSDIADGMGGDMNLMSLASDIEVTKEADTSAFEVKLKSYFGFAENFTVSLKKDGAEVDGPSSIVLGPDEKEGIASFSNLSKGTYELTVSSEGRYLAYAQEINIESVGYLYWVELFTAYENAAYAHEEWMTGGLPGALLLGDLNGDGSINQGDAKLITEAIAKGSSGENLKEDLNGDKKVDLTDLHLLAQNMGRENLSATLCSKVRTENIGISHKEGVALILEGGAADVRDALFGDEVTKAVGLSSSDEISEENPVELSMELVSEDSTVGVEMEEVKVSTPAGGNALKTGSIIIEGTDGNTYEAVFSVEDQQSSLPAVVGTMGLPGLWLTASGLAPASGNIPATAVIDQDGNIVVNLGGKIAVKKVTIRVTATQSGNKLAEISKVEFLNGMEDHIPEPQMSVPGNLKAEAGNQSFLLTWDAQTNVTGYEIQLYHKEKDASWTVVADTNVYDVTAFNGEEIMNLEHYYVRVRSVNGDWRSPYTSDSDDWLDWVEVVPKPSGLPPAPDNVSAIPSASKIDVSWKKMKDTSGYILYCQEKGKDVPVEYGTEEQPIADNKYTISNLQSATTYTVWVKGVNCNGVGPESFKNTVTTTTLDPVEFPKYAMLTTPNGQREMISHVKSATYDLRDTRSKGMTSSFLDMADGSYVPGSAIGVVDNDPGSYYYTNDWDDGGSYYGYDKGVFVTLDDKYKMDTIRFADAVNSSYAGCTVGYRVEGQSALVKAEIESISSKTDSKGGRYNTIKLKNPIETDQIQLCIWKYTGPIGISEIRFYNYDSLEDDILAVYGDDLMHLSLAEGVTAETLNQLQTRLDTPDPDNGEYHPDREMLQKELDYAKQLLNDQNALAGVKIQKVATSINGDQDDLGFGGLNAWQPLGITAYEGEDIVLYVGGTNRKPGDGVNLQVVVTQYHAESGAYKQEITQKLKAGRNQITIPKIATFDFERGGSVYIQYTGKNTTDEYAVRVLGGHQIPVLNLYQVDQAQWQGLAETYVAELEKQVQNLETLHNQDHKGSGIAAVDKDYAANTCILNATEIMLNQMMLSVASDQLLSGLGSGSVSQKAEKLVNSMKAMEDMMTLFYHHKGLSNAEGAGAKNHLPKRHLNIRYHRMFAGAFMYAGGDHIGIDDGSVAGLAGGVPIVATADGKYISGNYFGWGIAHEIGHDINQSIYALAEVTNNYFSVLAQAQETNESVRFEYDKVYDKVTSGTTGRDANVFTTLGMYWQLHLAYDKGYNYKIYDTYQEQLDNLFFARVDTYARDASAAPVVEGEKKHALSLNGDRDQIIMRLSIAAAKKDLTDFFRRWGMVPDAETLAYAAQFEKEERAIYYVNDEARVYQLEHKNSADIALGKDVVGDVDFHQSGNQVTLQLSAKNISSEAVLGYEISRISIAGGKEEKKVIGFTTSNTFVDTISTINNRVFTYEVVVVDKFLNRSAAKRVGSVKISHDGSYDKTYWTISTNMVSADDAADQATEKEPCAPEVKSAITRVIDTDPGTVYAGSSATLDPEIILQLNEVQGITALKYTAGSENRIKDFVLYLSEDGNWENAIVLNGTFTAADGAETFYFTSSDNKSVCTYDAAYVKLVAKGQKDRKLSIGEIDLLGPTGDNVEFVTEDASNPAFGYLRENYSYAEGQYIPAGSLVFVIKYKGNPAFNTVILYDEKGQIVGGVDAEGTLTAQQIVMADDPGHGELGETSEGVILYWLEPASGGIQVPAKVRAELYRVNNAETQEGQRLVSDTQLVTIPETLGGITLSGSAN